MSEAYGSSEDGGFSECIESAFEDAVYNLDREPVTGDIITIYTGDVVNFCIASFVPSMVESISENMYEKAGEYAENWIVSDKEAKQLQKMVEKAVDEWADDNSQHPNFYIVENVKPVKYKYSNNEWTKADDH